MPIDGATGLSRDSSAQLITPGFRCGSRPGLLEHPDRHRPHVVQRRVVAALVEPLLGLRPARLRTVTEGEQGFLATQFGTAARDVEDLVGLHEHPRALGTQLARHRDERAVVAGVAAQMRHRDEHLARIRDRQPAARTAAAGRFQAGVAHPGRAGTQIREILAAGGQRDRRLVDVEGDTVAGSTQNASHRGRRGSFSPRRNHRGGQRTTWLRVQGHSPVTVQSWEIIRASHNLKLG